MPRSRLLVDGRRAGDGERGDHGKYLGLFCCQRSSFKPVPGQACSGSRCAGAGHSFSLSLHSSDTRRTCVLWVLNGHSICLIPVGWGHSWRIVRKVRIVRTFPGSGCRGGLSGRLHPICMWHANRFPIFFKLPSRQCSASRVLEYLLRFQSLPAKRIPVVQVSPVIKNVGHVKRKIHEVLQWQEDPSRHALRGVQGMGRRQVCRCAGAAQLASRARGLEIACVGAG